MNFDEFFPLLKTIFTKDDCDMEQHDIAAMLKRRRWQNNPEKYREKQRTYRERIRDNLPNCNQCENCILVKIKRTFPVIARSPKMLFRGSVA